MFFSASATLALILSIPVEGFVSPQNKNFESVGIRQQGHGISVGGACNIAALSRNMRTERKMRSKSSILHLSSVGADEFIAASTNNKNSPVATEDVLSSSMSLATTATVSSTPSPEDTVIELEESVPQSFTPFQQTIRALPFVTTAAYLYDPKPLDDLVENIWSVIYDWDVAQYALFEAEVAVFGFFLWIVMFSSLHLFLGEERTKASRFDGELPHKPFEWAMPENYHLWFNPVAAYLGSIWLYLQIHIKPPMPEIAPSFGVLAIETLFGIWLYDLCFMPIHYLMHNWKLGSVRRVHGYHHRSGTTLNALETVQHSYIDGFLQVFVNIMVQKVSPFGGAKHVMSRLLHNLSVTYLLSEAHSGYRDLPWMSHLACGPDVCAPRALFDADKDLGPDRQPKIHHAGQKISKVIVGKGQERKIVVAMRAVLVVQTVFLFRRRRHGSKESLLMGRILVKGVLHPSLPAFKNGQQWCGWILQCSPIHTMGVVGNASMIQNAAVVPCQIGQFWMPFQMQFGEFVACDRHHGALEWPMLWIAVQLLPKGIGNGTRVIESNRLM